MSTGQTTIALNVLHRIMYRLNHRTPVSAFADSSLLSTALQVKCREVDIDTLVQCHAAVLATFLENVRWSGAGGGGEATGAGGGSSTLAAALSTAGWPDDRQAALISLAAEAAPPTRRLLASLDHGPARLVDIRWREIADWRCSVVGAADEGEESQFELTLVTVTEEGGEEKEETMLCSRHQMRDMLAELRQAGRAMQSLADGTAEPPPPPPPPSE